MKAKFITPKILYRLLKIFLWIIGGIVICSLSIMLLLLIPKVQEFVVNKTTQFVSEKTNMNARVGTVHIGFPKTIRLGDIFIEDLEKDTLLYCKEIAISAEILPLIRQKFNIDYLLVEELKGKVVRNMADSSFNFSPLLEAFSNNKPTNEKPPNQWNLGFNEFELKNINLSYSDQLDSTAIEFQLGHLAITADNSDILKMEFDLDKIELGQTSLKLMIGDKNKKTGNKPSNKEKFSIPIQVSLNELEVEDIAFDLGFTSDKLSIGAFIKKSNIEPSKIELANQKIILHNLLADGIQTKLRIRRDTIADLEEPSQIEESTSKEVFEHTFGNFDWDFLVHHVELQNVAYQMDLNNQPRMKTGMDYMHMDYSDFNVMADSLYFNKNTAGGTVHSFSVKEISGPEIKAVKGKFSMDNKGIYAESFDFKTPFSWLRGSAKLSYPALRLIGQEIKKLGFDVNVSGKINTLESRYFTSVLDDYPLLKQVNEIDVQKISLEGILSDLTLHEAKIGIGNSTILRANGHISGLPSTDIDLSYAIDTLITNKVDLLTWLPDTLLPSGILLPEHISFKSIGNTDFENGNISGEIKSDLGKVSLEASLQNEKINADIEVAELELGAIFKDSIAGKLNLRSHIDGRMASNTIKSFSAVTNLKSVELNNYNYQNGSIIVDWIDDIYSFSASLSDSSIEGNLTGKFSLLDSKNKLNLNLELLNSNLNNLNLTDDFFTANGVLNMDIEIVSKEEFNGLVKLQNTNLANSINKFHIDEISLESDINPNFTNFTLNSEILDAYLIGNTKIGEYKSAIVDHLDHYISLPDSLISEKDFNFEYNLKLKNPDFLTKFLIPDLGEIEMEKFHGKYVDYEDLLETEIIIPKLNYNGIVFNDLSFLIDSKQKSTTVELFLKSLNQGKTTINNMQLKSIFTAGLADIDFNVHDINDSLKFQLLSHLNYQDSVYRLVIDPNHTIFNYEKWTIPHDNYLQLNNGKFSSMGTRVSKGDQIFWIDTEENVVKLNFERFQIDNFMNIMEYDSSDYPINGKLSGYVELMDPFAQLKINSDLHIPNLSYNNKYLGNLHGKLNYNPSSFTGFNVNFQNEVNIVDIAGTIVNQDDKNQIQIVLESNIDSVSYFQPFFADYAQNLEGALKGRLAISGDLNNQKVNGYFNTTNLNFVLVQTNTLLKNNGGIIIKDNLLRFETFVIRDSLDNPITIEGDVDFENQQNPRYNLSINTDEFLAVNANPQKDLPVIGQLILGTDITISGKQSDLNVTTNLSIKKGTDITYIMPSKDLELITDEDVVQFVDFDDIQLESGEKVEEKNIADSIASLLKGIDFKANLQIDPEAKFKVIVDPNSGDYTEFQVMGKLQYRYDDVERGTLSGLIEFKKGFYELSFYGLVKKRFDYDPGSTISWADEIMEGKVIFSARHTVRTNSVGLVSNEISSYERSLYNQRLPYDVILKVEESINNPRISFFIDLPERYRSTHPTIDSKLNILNQPSMESERNKQVFALLVGGTFIIDNPTSSDGSSSNFATSAARNSVSSILTQQLNKLSGQLIKAVDLNMGINTFEDYGTGKAETRTQLDVKVSKTLLNNRLSAEVESHIDLDGSTKNIGNQNTAGMMEFAVSYSITEAGNYRIKVFSENAYDLYDGEIQNSGLAFIFVKEFEHLRKKKNKSSKKVKDTTVEAGK